MSINLRFSQQRPHQQYGHVIRATPSPTPFGRGRRMNTRRSNGAAVSHFVQAALVSLQNLNLRFLQQRPHQQYGHLHGLQSVDLRPSRLAQSIQQPFARYHPA